jgi:hypothetical protein
MGTYRMLTSQFSSFFSFNDILLLFSPEGLFSDLLERPCGCIGQSNQSFGPRRWPFAASKKLLEVELLGPFGPR